MLPQNRFTMGKLKKNLKKVWWFIWEDDSLLSWIVNIVLAFILIKFIVYPGLGLLLGTNYPVVAVVSGSMEHKLVPTCVVRDVNGNCLQTMAGSYEICGMTASKKVPMNLDNYWSKCGPWYEDIGITENQFKTFIFHNGFNTGDIIILHGKDPKDIKVGDVIVFASDKPYPIIHRVISRENINGTIYFNTKGDHNPTQGPDDIMISQQRLLGKAFVRIPYLGWIKIGFFDLVNRFAMLIGLRG